MVRCNVFYCSDICIQSHATSSSLDGRLHDQGHKVGHGKCNNAQLMKQFWFCACTTTNTSQRAFAGKQEAKDIALLQRCNRVHAG